MKTNSLLIATALCLSINIFAGINPIKTGYDSGNQNKSAIPSRNPKIEKIAGEENEHIIDFIFTDKEHFLQIDKMNNQYYLKMSNDNNSENSMLLDFKPKMLFKDIFGKIYVLSDKKAYEVNYESGIKIIGSMSTRIFDMEISNTILKKDNYEIASFQPYGFQEYDIYKYYDDQTCQKLMLVNYDKNDFPIQLDETTARRRELYKKQNRKFWKDYYSEAYNDLPTPSERIMSYAAPDSLIYTFDLWNGKFLQLDLTKSKYKIYKMDLQGKTNAVVQHDETAGKYYISSFENGVLTIDEVNTENGSLTQKLQLHDLLSESNLKIENNKLYFTEKNDAGFRKLYKIDL